MQRGDLWGFERGAARRLRRRELPNAFDPERDVAEWRQDDRCFGK
jgi:hypothetical protein